VAESGSHARRGRFADRKVKIALLIAGVEGLLLLFGRLSRWVVIAVAIPLVLVYLLRGRELRPGLARNVLWIVAASQVLVVVAAIVAFFVGLLVLVLLGIFAGVAFLLIYLDQPGRASK
jgi:cation transport ATPase